MIKAQNNALVEKLKIQVKKMNEQYKLMRDWVISGDMNGLNQTMAARMMENFKGVNHFSQ